MGAKHALAPSVAGVIAELEPGPCLDMFSGLCSVAGAIAPSGRETWCNDIQRYARLVAEALVTAPRARGRARDIAMILFPTFRENLQALKSRFAADLAAEADALADDDYQNIARVTDAWHHVGNDAKLAGEVRRLRSKPSTRPYRLCTLTFSHSYFGLRQAAELDSLRCAIDESRKASRISQGQFTLCLVTVLQVASRIASAPGHFAEFLTVRDQSTFLRMKRLRRRSVWELFQSELEKIEPYGTATWRSGNKVLSREAVGLARTLAGRSTPPTVVYADPPYSKAQYSRYYHVLETLTLYDYPCALAKGRYREARFQTPFSNVGTVSQAFEDLITRVAASGASLVLSYPSNGLLFESDTDPVSMLAKSYRSVRLAAAFRKRHSTMGAAHGASRRDVQEMIFVARRCR